MNEGEEREGMGRKVTRGGTREERRSEVGGEWERKHVNKHSPSNVVSYSATPHPLPPPHTHIQTPSSHDQPVLIPHPSSLIL